MASDLTVLGFPAALVIFRTFLPAILPVIPGLPGKFTIFGYSNNANTIAQSARLFPAVDDPVVSKLDLYFFLGCSLFTLRGPIFPG